MTKKRIQWTDWQASEVAMAYALLRDIEPGMKAEMAFRQVQEEVLPPELRRTVTGPSQLGVRAQAVLSAMTQGIQAETAVLQQVEQAVNRQFAETPTKDLVAEVIDRQNRPVVKALESLDQRISAIEGVFLDIAVGLNRLSDMIGNSELRIKLEGLVKAPVEVQPVAQVPSNELAPPKDCLIVVGCHSNLEALLKRNYPEVKFHFVNGAHPKKLGNILVFRDKAAPVLVGPHRHSVITTKLRARGIPYRSVLHHSSEGWMSEVERILITKERTAA